MSGGGGSTPTTTTSTTYALPDYLQPHLEGIASDASSLYTSGVGAGYYPGSTYIGPTDKEQWALDELHKSKDLSETYDTAKNSIAASNQVIGSDGFTSSQLGFLDPAQQIATGANSITTGNTWSNMMNQFAPGNSSVMSNLEAVARGDYLAEPEANFMKSLDLAADKVRSNVDQSLSSMGRYGSGSHQQVMSDSIGNLYANQLADYYNQERARQVEAANLMDQSAMGFGNMAYQGLQGLTNTQAANIANQGSTSLALGQQAANASQNALSYINSLSGMQDMVQRPYEETYQLGQQERQELYNQLQDQVARWDASQKEPWEMLSMYSAALMGAAPGTYGTPNATQTVSNNQQNSSWGNTLSTLGLLGSLLLRKV